MRKLAWLLALAVFVLNPAFACSDEPQFQYGAEEMRAAVEGEWSFTLTPEGGTATEVTVHLEQTTAPATAARVERRGLVRAAHACGTRTLVKSAGACVDLSELPLAVHWRSGDPAFDVASLSGTFTVFGLTFTGGTLFLQLGAYTIQSQVNADGSLGQTHVMPAATVTVERL